VKLIKAAQDKYQFQLSCREEDLLLHLLTLYPRIPSGYQPLSKNAAQESNQRLLDEALAETRAQNKTRLASFLTDPRKLKEVENGWHLTINSDEVESLLQVLNDVRIGSWILLGSPDRPMKVLNPESGPHLWAMEMAGYFQMRFLELLDA
jgi:hypothetical protein